MNWAFVVAGLLSLVAAAIHGGVGDRIVRRIDNDLLPGNPFEGLSSKLLIRVTWHFVTIAFGVIGGALIWVGSTPTAPAAKGVAFVAGAMYVGWSLFALSAGMSHRGLRAFRAHPAPIIFVLTDVLIIWGATNL